MRYTGPFVLRAWVLSHSRVAYAVTRTELSEINATTKQIFEERAFQQGLLVKEGQAKSVESVWVEARDLPVAARRCNQMEPGKSDYSYRIELTDALCDLVRKQRNLGLA